MGTQFSQQCRESVRYSEKIKIMSPVRKQWAPNLLIIIIMNYTQEISSAPVVLVEFYATWCPHCRKMMPVMEDIKTLLADNLKVLQFDIDKNEALADQEKVNSLPTFILYSDGKEVMRETGEMPGEVLLQKIQAAIS